MLRVSAPTNRDEQAIGLQYEHAFRRRRCAADLPPLIRYAVIE